MHLVDTSVWIDFLRGKETPRVGLLESLLESGDAAICETIFYEICIGAASPRQFRNYRERFSGIPFLRLPQNWHLQGAEMGYRLRSEGYKPYLSDLTIALTAILNQVPLLTADKDFEAYRRLYDLAVE
ncbi:MAG: PIN domain nuclease [Deltaproteobacteria bacterium]|nr:PIN domain nuclease [Deltaproteobacteria bacterium]